MTQAVQAPLPLYFGLDGRALQAGNLYFGVAEMNPETNPIIVYWDAELTQPAAQPVRTINGMPSRNGTPAQLYVNSDHSLTIRDFEGRLVLNARNSLEYSLEAQLRNFTSGELGAGMIGFDQSLAYAANSVGFNLSKRKAVFGTGVAATDVANLNAAMAAAQPYDVIELFGAFTTNDQIDCGSELWLMGKNCTITHTNPATHCFAFIDEYYASGNGTTRVWPVADVSMPPRSGWIAPGNAYPGQIRMSNFRIRGPLDIVTDDPRLPANNEPLGTLTRSNIKCAIAIDCNALNLQLDRMFIDRFHTGIMVNSVSFATIRDIDIYECKFGLALSGVSNGCEIDVFAQICFVGLSYNYGNIRGDVGQAPGVQQFTATAKINGKYQDCFVGMYLRSLYNVQSDQIYFERNGFRDLQLGDGAGGPFWGQVTTGNFNSINSAIENGTAPNNGGTGGIASSYTLVGNPLFPGDAAIPCSIDFALCSGTRVTAYRNSGAVLPSTRWVVLDRGNGTNNSVQTGNPETLVSPKPFNIAIPSRMVLGAGENMRYGLTKSGTFWSYPIAFGDVNAERFLNYNDPGFPSGVATGVKNWLSFEFRRTTGIQGLVLGGRDASTAFGSDGGEVRVEAASFIIATQDGQQELMLARTGTNAWGFQHKQIVFTALGVPIVEGAFALENGYGQASAIPTVASAATMGYTALAMKTVSKVSGVAAISTLTPPTDAPAGMRITLIPTGAWSTVTGGNISRAVSAVVNVPLDFIWDPSINQWFIK